MIKPRNTLNTRKIKRNWGFILVYLVYKGDSSRYYRDIVWNYLYHCRALLISASFFGLCITLEQFAYDADAQNAALPEPEKPKGPTDADVRRLADEIKSLKRPPPNDDGGSHNLQQVVREAFW